MSLRLGELLIAGSTGDCYTKIESDAKYPSIADVYTKTESDAKYPAIADVYTKTESDAKYAVIGNSYTKSESDAKYPAIGNVYTKTESNSLYLPIINSATLSITGYNTGWSADTSSRYVNRCYKITNNMYYICIFIKCSSNLTAGTTYTAINAGGITVGGKVPQVCTVSAVDRDSQKAVGCWINYQGLVYVNPTGAVTSGNGICIAGIVHTP